MQTIDNKRSDHQTVLNNKMMTGHLNLFENILLAQDSVILAVAIKSCSLCRGQQIFRGWVGYITVAGGWRMWTLSYMAHKKSFLELGSNEKRVIYNFLATIINLFGFPMYKFWRCVFIQCGGERIVFIGTAQSTLQRFPSTSASNHLYFYLLLQPLRFEYFIRISMFDQL